ncbi:MAG: hypothetical protein O2799_01755, partial [Planctomycetota bacterium]|nr:hypothetical protein [Planctomycetota bacterium]
PEPQVAAVTPDSEAPDREPAAEPVLSPVPSSDTPLTGSVERWESGRRRRARMVQGALTAWAVLLVAAWVQFEAEGQGTVQAAGWAGADNGSEAAPEDRSVSGTVVRPVEASATAPDRSPEQSPVVVEPRVAADAGESTPGTLAVGAPLAAAGVEDSSGVSAAGPSSAGEAAPAPAVEAVPESASAQPTEAVDAAVTSAAPEPAAAYSAHRETPRFAGAPCAWWEMTRPGGDLRRVLGPCKGPYDEQHGAIVGLHRQGSEHLCSHHLRFVRDLGGDLEAELASAAAAREGGLPSPLLAMRIDGAARSMVRERVGRWVQSGFEGGDDHELEALGGDTWRVRTWVVAALEGEEPRRLEVELVLTLGDGPHDDTLQSFRFPRKR